MADASGASATVESAPAAAIRLVAIGRDGAPGEPVGGPGAEMAQACAATAGMYDRAGFVPPWIGYLVVAGDAPVGTCAFKSAPRDARAEIAWFTAPAHRGRGYAPGAARAILAIAAASEPGLRLTARTLPRHGPSTGVLGRLGFRLAGTVEDPEDGPVREWLAPGAMA